MDLAAQLGVTADGLARTMTETEFVEWQHYANKRMLPQRRLELYLAQIAMLIAAHMGGVKNAKLSDYMFDPSSDDIDDDGTGEASVEEAAAFFGFNPRNKE